MVNGTFLLWHAFFQIIDSGSLAELDAGSNFPGKIVAIVTIFIGLVLFSSMVAFITQEFENRISTLKKGKSQVLEEDHVLIVGFSERVIEIIKELIVNSDIAKVSLVGAGMRSQAGVASKAFKALSENDVNIQIICTSEIKITMVIDEALVDKAVNVLHEEFELEK